MAAIEVEENLMHLLPRWFRITRRAQVPSGRRARHYDDPVLAEDERSLGCGWFDSSHELMRGLVIVERMLPPRPRPLSAAN